MYWVADEVPLSSFYFKVNIGMKKKENMRCSRRGIMEERNETVNKLMDLLVSAQHENFSSPFTRKKYKFNKLIKIVLFFPLLSALCLSCKHAGKV
jgi:hypothetical protein